MKIYKISSNIIVAYHGSSTTFKKFDAKFSAQGVFWFTEDIDSIKNQTSGANSNRYIAKVELIVDKTAGWEEYEKKYLEQIRADFDSVKLDDDWIIFDPNRIEIKEWYKST